MYLVSIMDQNCQKLYQHQSVYILVRFQSIMNYLLSYLHYFYVKVVKSQRFDLLNMFYLYFHWFYSINKQYFKFGITSDESVRCRWTRTPSLVGWRCPAQYNLDCFLIKLLHLNMRKANSHNFSTVNKYVQPEDQDHFRNIQVSYRQPYETAKVEVALSPRINDNKFAFLDARAYNQRQPDIQFGPKSPRAREFLRHTTYVSKVEPIMEKKKSQLSSSMMSNKFPKKSSPMAFENTQREVLSTQSSPVYSSHLKTYGNQKYDSLASKVLNTASFIEQLKRFKEEKSKVYEPCKYSYMTSETEKFQQSNSTNYLFDNGFRKKLAQDFYTPKPEPNANLQKIKRGYTPNQVIKKIVSPSHKKTVTIQDFILETKLGGGKFGTVWRAFHVKTRSLFALKKIPKKMLKENMMVDQFLLEVKLQTFLKHENIVEIYGVFDDKEHVYLILEYMEEGTLYSELKKKKKLSQNQTGIKVKQIAKAITYMHENGIVHRDIKPENIVMSGGVCKLCDFGWATICEDRRKTYCGTFDYAAPEIIEGAQYDLSVDLWCLGVLTYELMVGKAPFYHVSRKETISNILNVENKKISFPAGMSSKAISFINSLLKKNPEERLSYEQLLNHPFLKQVEEDAE